MDAGHLILGVLAVGLFFLVIVQEACARCLNAQTKAADAWQAAEFERQNREQARLKRRVCDLLAESNELSRKLSRANERAAENFKLYRDMEAKTVQACIELDRFKTAAWTAESRAKVAEALNREFGLDKGKLPPASEIPETVPPGLE